MRDLLRQLPRLHTDGQGNVDHAHSDRAIVAATGQNAACMARALHMGIGAIGHLLATSAPQIEDGSVDHRGTRPRASARAGTAPLNGASAAWMRAICAALTCSPSSF